MILYIVFIGGMSLAGNLISFELARFSVFGLGLFNNISVILWWTVLLVMETEEHAENHRPVTSH